MNGWHHLLILDSASQRRGRRRTQHCPKFAYGQPPCRDQPCWTAPPRRLGHLRGDHVANRQFSKQRFELGDCVCLQCRQDTAAGQEYFLECLLQAAQLKNNDGDGPTPCMCLADYCEHRIVHESLLRGGTRIFFSFSWNSDSVKPAT